MDEREAAICLAKIDEPATYALLKNPAGLSRGMRQRRDDSFLTFISPESTLPSRYFVPGDPPHVPVPAPDDHLASRLWRDLGRLRIKGRGRCQVFFGMENVGSSAS